jgi:hypothetical protein
VKIKGGACTVSEAVPETLLNAALMVTGPPGAAPVASPEALIVAIVGSDEVQVTDAVRSCWLLSEKVPVATNCSVFPARTVAGFGVTAIDCSVAVVTVSVSPGLVTPLKAAVICVVPVPTPVASPALVIVATAGVPEVHVAWLVRSCVLLSVYVPVALNCWLSPFAIDGLTGVTAIDCSVAAVTVSVSPGLVTPLKAAVICVVPVPTPVASPALVIVATVGVPEVHVTWLVRSSVLLSVYVPVALNCSVSPFAIDGLTGVTAIDTSVAAVTVSVSPGLVTPPSAAVICVVPVPTPVASPALVIVATAGVPDTHVA